MTPMLAPPPSLPERLLLALMPPAERDEVLADLRAERATRAARDGAGAARRWMWKQVAASLPALLGRSVWRGRTGFESRANRARPGGNALESWILDFRYTLRRLRRRPLYATLAVATLALGVGGAAAIAGLVRGVLLEPLPYAHEERLGIFTWVYDWSESEMLYLRPDFPGFQDVAAYAPLDVTLHREGSPAQLVPGIQASAELFDVLGSRPLLGRGFQKGDDVRGAERVAVLSYGLWQQLGGDPALVGQRLRLGGRERTVIGVMPRGFWFPSPDVRVWVPSRLDPDNGSGDYALVGRLASGVSFSALPSYMKRLSARLAGRFHYPADWDKTKDLRLTPIRDALVGPLRPALWATLAAMAMILLIACANVAALTLGQLEGRTTELAARLALGAEQRRLVQQLVAEAIVLGGAAAAVGAALAAAGFRLLVAALPLGAWAEQARLDGSVFAAALVAALVAGLLLALLPTMSLARRDLRGALAMTRTRGVAGRGGRLESGLVVAEVALAVLLTAGAALVAHSVSNLYAVDPGFETRGLAVVDLVLPAGSTLGERQRTVHEMVDGLAALPGVTRVAASQKLPLRGPGSSAGIAVVGRAGDADTTTYFRFVTPGYFEALRLPLVAGRTFTSADRALVPSGDGSEIPVVVNQALASEYFRGESPLGRVLTGGIGVHERIVGVVGNIAEARLSDPPVPARYWLTDQAPFGLDAMSFVLRAAPGLDPVSLLEPARATVERLAPAAAVRETTTMERVLDQAVGPARQVMRLLAILTGLAVLLGAVGVYGVLAHFVARRQRDWAIRMALGFSPSHVVGYVVRRGVALVLAGIAIGGGLALALSRLLRSLLFHVGAADPVALAVAGATLLVVGIVAALVPAWRASRTHPALLLREV